MIYSHTYLLIFKSFCCSWGCPSVLSLKYFSVAYFTTPVAILEFSVSLFCSLERNQTAGLQLFILGGYSELDWSRSNHSMLHLLQLPANRKVYLSEWNAIMGCCKTWNGTEQCFTWTTIITYYVTLIHSMYVDEVTWIICSYCQTDYLMQICSYFWSSLFLLYITRLTSW